MKQMEHVYPEIGRRPGFTLEVINLEEERFEETLTTGLELIENIMAERETDRAGEISGEDAFRLYDTYGFPVELTKEIAEERGFSIDLAGFDKEMDKQRERARAARETAKLDEKTVTIHPAREVESADYGTLKHKSIIINISVDNEFKETINEGQKASVILENAIFYAEMGGQVGDTGEIFSQSGRFSVVNTLRMPSGVVIHQGQVTEGSLSIGDEVEAEVDKERRLDTARSHTATHLLQAALRQVLGEHIQQRGSLVAPDRLRFDFSHLKAVTKEEIDEAQRFVNDKIRQNLPVYDEDIPYQQAIEEGAIALFDEKYGDVVRVLKIGKPPVSAELCGGTHVIATGEIGLFHITSESSIGTGLRRIEAVTGRGAEIYAAQRLADLEKKVAATASALDMERRHGRTLERELSKKTTESLLNQAEMINGVRVLSARVPPARMDMLREMSDLLREQLKSVIIVLGTIYEDKPVFLTAVTPDLIAKGYNAGEIIKKVAAVAGGGGGGKATLAQAGGKYKDKLDEALRSVKDLI